MIDGSYGARLLTGAGHHGLLLSSQICRFGEVSTVHIVYGELKSVRKEVQIELGKGWERKGSFCHPAAYLSPKTQDYMASFLLHSNTWQLLTGVGC